MGDMEGEPLRVHDGLFDVDGEKLGFALGTIVGKLDGSVERDGGEEIDGLKLGLAFGSNDGDEVGDLLGGFVGDLEGSGEGFIDTDGCSEGCELGEKDGIALILGINEGSCARTQ